MIKLTFYTETSLPQSLSPTSIYYIKASGNSKATCYITDSGGNAYPLTITESFVKSINESVTPDTTGNLSLALSMDNSGNLGITGNQSTVNLDVRFRKNSDKVNFITDLSAKPSTLSGYGITDAVNVSQLSDIESANIIGVATPTTNPGTPTANVGYNVSNLSLTSTLTYPNFTVKDPISGNLVQFVQPINSSGVIRYSTTLGYWEYAPQAFDKSGLAVTGNINTLAPQLTTAGKYISSDDGSQPSASGYNVLTTPMNVTPGQSISFSGASYQQYAFYKSDGTFLSGYNGNPIKNTVIVPANAAFFNYTIIDADLPTLSVVVSNVAPPRGLPFAKSLNPQYSDGTMLLNPDAVISAAKSNLNETILTYNDSTNFDYWPVPISVNGKLLAIVASIKELCREVNKYLKKEVLLPSSERGYINTNPTRYSIWAENYTIVTYLLHDSSVCDLTTCTRATSWANIDKERFYWASNADIQQTVKYGQIKFGSTVLFDGGTKNFLAHSSAEAWFNVKPILQNPELKKRLGKILCLDESVSGFPSSGIALQM